MTPEAFVKEANRLLALACPTPEAEPFFNRHMAVAKGLRMTWVEGLRYVIEQRDWNGGMASLSHLQ